MTIEQTIDIAAPPQSVWAVLTEVERWPEWTASVTGVELIEGKALEVGSRVRVRQPRLPVAVWTVTALEPPRYFEWRNSAAGLKSVAGHRVDDIGQGRSHVTLTLEWRGVLAPLVRLLYGRLTRRYMTAEAQGLRRRCESSGTPST